MSDKKWSETPRTDAATSWDHERYVDERGQVASVKVVRAAFAGQLERELAEANAGFGRLTKLADQVSDTCKRLDEVVAPLERELARLRTIERAYCAANDYINALATPSVPAESLAKIKTEYWKRVREVQ